MTDEEIIEFTNDLAEWLESDDNRCRLVTAVLEMGDDYLVTSPTGQERGFASVLKLMMLHAPDAQPTA